MKKRMLALVLSGLMLTGTLVGCGGDKAPAGSGGSSAGGSSAVGGGDGE